jgi:hypothetical protein
MEKLEFKGTKGEWLVKENETRFPSSLTDEVVDENGDVLFKVFLANNDIEYKANSKLIAVAPQLLECLQQMVEMYEEVQPCGGYQGYYDEAVYVIKKALM